MIAKSLVVAAFCLATVSAEAPDRDCDGDEFAKSLGTLGGIVFAGDLRQLCLEDSGYDYGSPSALPNSTTTLKMCNSASCPKLVNAIKATDIPDCRISVLGYTYNVYRQVNEFAGKCKDLQNPTTSRVPTTTVPATTVPPPNAC